MAFSVYLDKKQFEYAATKEFQFFLTVFCHCIWLRCYQVVRYAEKQQSGASGLTCEIQQVLTWVHGQTLESSGSTVCLDQVQLSVYLVNVSVDRAGPWFSSDPKIPMAPEMPKAVVLQYYLCNWSGNRNHGWLFKSAWFRTRDGGCLA